METPSIRYNLRERGRKHTGQSRNFNVRAICDAINGASCQEMVSSGGMFGFYGHMPRIRYGMEPCEGVIDGGKYVPVEPAFVTTYLKADYDGNIEHKARFLDTAAGRLCQKLWGEQVGGFSSAIDEAKPQFFGYDYVLAPNFLSNSYRGVVLDDAFGGGVPQALTYDDIYQAEKDEQSHGMMAIIDRMTIERNAASETIERLRSENDELLDMLAKKSLTPPSFDSGYVLPVAVKTDKADRLTRDTRYFRNANALPSFVAPSTHSKDDQVYDSIVSRLTRK